MSVALLLEQVLNGLGFGLMLFALAAGLTLVFGIMNFLNLSHGSLFMVGAYLGAEIHLRAGSFSLALIGGTIGACVLAALLEYSLLRRLYARSHLTQVLATFGIILVLDDLARMYWGPAPLQTSIPEALSGWAVLPGGLHYPVYRLLLLCVGGLCAVALYLLVNRTRLGMLVRAGASDRQMAEWMGVKVRRVFALLFAVGGGLAGIAGALMGPIISVQPGIGEEILIPSLVVLVIGGIGSIKGAFVAALLVGLVDTTGRFFLPIIFRASMPPDLAAELGPAVAGIAMYALMAGVLIFKPAGIFSARH